MALNTLLGVLLAWSLASIAAADFTVAFDAVAAGSALRLAWDAVDSASFPLIVGVSMINQTGGGRAYGLKANISAAVYGSSYTWQSVPYPLEYLPTAQYQLEVRPSKWADGQRQPVVAKSPFFTIFNDAAPQQASPTGFGQPSSGGADGSSSAGDSGWKKTLAIALGTSIGVTSLLAAMVVGCCIRKKRGAVLNEKRAEKIRQGRRDFMID